MPKSDRLTKRNDSGGITVQNPVAAFAKLAEIEDAEEYKRSLIKAAKKIAEFCNNNKNCADCPFFEWNIRNCALDGELPNKWKVFGMNAEDGAE